MAEAQTITIVLSTVPTFLVVLIGLLLNNSRLNDLRDGLRMGIKASGAELRAELAIQSAKIDVHHSELLMKFADLDRRLIAVERIR